MSGSIKHFVYTSDQGTDFAIKLDESNTEQVNGSVQDFPAVPPTVFSIPRNVKPRHLIYANAARTVTRKIVALTAAIFNGAQTNVPSYEDPVSGETLILFRKVGEVISFPFGADTGQQDGDAT